MSALGTADTCGQQQLELLLGMADPVASMKGCENTIQLLRGEFWEFLVQRSPSRQDYGYYWRVHLVPDTRTPRIRMECRIERRPKMSKQALFRRVLYGSIGLAPGSFGLNLEEEAGDRFD